MRRADRPGLTVRGRQVSLSAPELMGVLNVTPDSFSDGGRYVDPDSAVERGIEMAGQGAFIIDVGGVSSRPGALAADEDEELRRVVPVLERLAPALEGRALLSVDTCRPAVARRALELGAHIVNDITGLGDPQMRRVVAETGAGAVIMHMKGVPRTMQSSPHYDDVVSEVMSFLDERLKLAALDGVPREGLLLDPGLGFGKRQEDNIELVNGLSRLKELGRPVLVGHSRKSFVGRITGRERPEERLSGSIAAALFLAGRGADILRVHDVRETLDALSVWRALSAGREAGVTV